MSEDKARLLNLPRLFPRVFCKESKDLIAFEHRAGWAQLLTLLADRFDTILKADPSATMQVHQIKEKFGEPRFYYQLFNASQATHDAVDEAVEAA